MRILIPLESMFQHRPLYIHLCRRALTLQTASAALSQLATLSLAGSPPPQAVPQTSTSFASAIGVMHFDSSAGQVEQAIKQEEEEQVAEVPQPPSGELSGGGISIKNGKKRGTIFTCESCSKVCISCIHHHLYVFISSL